jgi:hypothetical protein
VIFTAGEYLVLIGIVALGALLVYGGINPFAFFDPHAAVDLVKSAVESLDLPSLAILSILAVVKSFLELSGDRRCVRISPLWPDVLMATGYVSLRLAVIFSSSSAHAGAIFTTRFEDAISQILPGIAASCFTVFIFDFEDRPRKKLP